MATMFDQDFCPACGTILPLPDGSSLIQCLLCKKIQNISVFHGAQSAVQIDFRGHTDDQDATDSTERLLHGTLIQRKCPKCGNEEMAFTTKQLRSADEGQTIFFHCPKCLYRESENS